MDRETLLDLIPAYALDALEADERAQVETLLATDAEARRLLADYQSVSDWLILSAPARPAPAHLNTDLRQRLAANRAVARESKAPAVPAAQRPLRSRPMSWLPVALGTAAALVVLLAGVLLLSRPNPPVDPAAALYTQIMAQGDVRTIPISPAEDVPSTQGELVMTADGTQAVIRVVNLPAIAPDQTFQLWLVRDDQVQSGGLFQFVNAEGPHYIIVPLEMPVQRYQAFGVSIEPEGGSPLPAGPSGPRVFGILVHS